MLRERDRYLMTSLNSSDDQPFANDGGMKSPAAVEADPYRVLDELMVVVEALCPIWPKREIFRDSGKMLL
jgi:hypothetical protein